VSSQLKVTPPEDFVEFSRDEIEQSVASLFEHKVQLYANRVAVTVGNRSITYAQLNQSANQVARALLEKKPFNKLSESNSDDLAFLEEHAEPVAVFMEQGIDAIIAAFGILKAGKIFVSIDPADPNTRKRYILNHAPARIILTDEQNVETVKNLAPPDCTVISTDQFEEGVGSENSTLPVSPLDPALLVYTSGSTGNPKGLIHSQRTLLHDVMVKTNLMKISASDRVSILSWGTGQAIQLIFNTLLNGASLYPFNLKRKGVTHLAAWMKQEKITLHTVSAPICRIFLELLNGNEEFPDLRLFRTASDTVHPRDIAQMKLNFRSDCFFVNALASNETGIICANVMNQSSQIDTLRIPIGFPVKDTKVSLLNDASTAKNGNKSGAIAVTSRYIASGYWRQPDLTRIAFSRGSTDREVVTFRSGDIGRLLPNGSLELLGRNDFQVKIRGYRVDTTEVEAALLENKNVADAVVGSCENEQGDRRLVAYVVPRQKLAPTTTALHRFLKGKLTDYMIPAAFVVMDSIPLLPSGKTNRRALPEPGRTRPALDNEYVAPRIPIEERLADIWSQVIEIECIGVHDHFLELGGDSLRAGQVMARIIDAFDIDLPLRLMFESSTVAEIAAVIEKRLKDVARVKDERTLERRPGKGPWQLSFGQKRLWFLDQLNPDSPAYNMPKAIHLTGELNVAALSEALDWIVERHEVLRTNYLSRLGVPEAVVAESGALELPLIDLRDHAETDREEELHRLITAESSRPFDLEHDLKIRNTLFWLGSEEYVLLCVTHHIASDGWSRDILMRELTANYEALVEGESSRMNELQIQYSDFARWQAEFEGTDALNSQMEYWIECLRGMPSSPDLPTDRPRPLVQRSRGSTFIFRMSQNTSQDLIDMARDEDVTLYMLLSSVFNVLLYRYTSQDDVVVGCPVAGRSLVETEELIGFFVNSLVMRNDLSGNPTFRELLNRIRDQALGAFAHSDVSFEQLVHRLNPKRDQSRNPLFQVMFQVHQPRSLMLQAGKVTFRLKENRRQTSPIDQNWNIAIKEDGLRIRVEYNTDLFDAATIERITGDFSGIVDQILIDPEVRINELPIVSSGSGLRN